MTRARPTPALFALALLGLAVAGCGEARDASAEVYTVRGEIARLPDPSRPDGAELYLRHEAIPTFRDRAGEVVGMEAMTMGFPLAASIELGGLAAGDPVEVDFEVRWHGGGPPLRITRLVPLAASPFAAESSETARPDDASRESESAANSAE